MNTKRTTAVEGLTVPMGQTMDLTAAQTLAVDTTDCSGPWMFRRRGGTNVTYTDAVSYHFDGGYITFLPELVQLPLLPVMTYNYVPSYHYYLRDHLGNNRMVVSGDGTIEQKNQYYPYGGPWGDISTYQGLQPFKYNGKELDRVHGLDWYDYGARRYDPAFAQFTQIDPLCEKYPHLSPYAYCAGNPVRYVDPDGEKPKPYEAALMAAHVYGGSKAAMVQKDFEATGWKISSKSTSIKMTHNNGLQSALYEKTIDGRTEYAYVFAGTNSLRDWAENIAQAGGLSVQYSVAVNNALQLVKELEGSELTFVGHSLGGGEAAAASMATGKAAITFNPASVSIPTRLLLMLGKSNNIENYIASGLKIPIMQTIIGGDPLYYLQSKIGMLPPGKKIYVPIGFKMPLKSHDILEMIMHIQHE